MKQNPCAGDAHNPKNHRTNRIRSYGAEDIGAFCVGSRYPKLASDGRPQVIVDDDGVTLIVTMDKPTRREVEAFGPKGDLELARLRAVDLITWDKGRIGMGWRTRHQAEYVVVLQREPLHAARTWRDHAIPDVWEEKVSKRHPHSKPVGLQERLIRAVTQPGELVVDPAAGGYSVLEACVRCDRNFCGCDVEFGGEGDDER